MCTSITRPSMNRNPVQVSRCTSVSFLSVISSTHCEQAALGRNLRPVPISTHEIIHLGQVQRYGERCMIDNFALRLHLDSGVVVRWLIIVVEAFTFQLKVVKLISQGHCMRKLRAASLCTVRYSLLFYISSKQTQPKVQVSSILHVKLVDSRRPTLRCFAGS